MAENPSTGPMPLADDTPAAFPDPLDVLTPGAPVAERLNQLVSRPAIDVVMDSDNAVCQLAVAEVGKLLARLGPLANPDQFVEFSGISCRDALSFQNCGDLAEYGRAPRRSCGAIRSGACRRWRGNCPRAWRAGQSGAATAPTRHPHPSRSSYCRFPPYLGCTRTRS
jgi:hypothetical protein